MAQTRKKVKLARREAKKRAREEMAVLVPRLGPGDTQPTRHDFYEFRPAEKCHKCGRHGWLPDASPMTWNCVYCGNIAYFVLGMIQQQIDVICNNHLRKDDYEKKGECIVPKQNAELRLLRAKMRLRGQL